MNEQQSISKTVKQWTPLAETGEGKPILNDVTDNCYLCQYAYEATGERNWGKSKRCRVCPYYKKYGMCNNSPSPFDKWCGADTKADKCIHAAAFLAQVKTLQEKPMDKKEIEKNIVAAKDDLESAQVRLDDALAQLADAEKSEPKLRHLDYGLNGRKEARITLLSQNGHYFSAGKGCCMDVRSDKFHPEVILGNLAADLAAQSGEPLEEFTVGDLCFRLKDTVVDVEDKSDDTFFYFSRKNLPEIILNLRKMELKMIMDAAKSK